MLGAFLALQIGPVMAQVNLGTAGLSAGGTVTGPILFPDGTAGAPSISFSSDSNMGWSYRTTGSLSFNDGSVRYFSFDPNQFAARSTACMGWWSGDIGTTFDTSFCREAAAGLQLGADNASGAAVDQTLSAADAITAADISGGDLTIQSGAGMGTGTVSSLIFQTPTVAAAGANPQSLATRLTLSSAGAVFGGSVQAAAGGLFQFTGRTAIASGADSILTVTEADGVGMTRVNLGGIVDDNPGIAISATVSGKSQGISIIHADGTAPVFTDLGAATNGSMIYCSDCTIANPCAGSGTGAIAKRLNGVWVCN